ncbi:MAG TPA: TIM-barrel domain-containing protein [Terriglobales bacterium]|nr:TIM-barrel domain-containing protein [Terriglobales bacterium]
MPVHAQSASAETQHTASLQMPGLYNPVADPRALVTMGNARFTVLTPQLIRMEWAADGKFEDHPSFVFLNRRLPVPKFSQSQTTDGDSKKLELKTDALSLSYSQSGNGKFTSDNLHIDFTLNGKQVSWHSEMEDKGNLQGTTRTLDGALGGKTREPIGPGLISRDGWTLVDDSTRPLFDSDDFRFLQGEQSPWPWVMQRPEGDRQDWYFFGYGHNYKQALTDFTRVAGRIPLPPRFAFGTWWSRYWAYSDQEFQNLVRGFRENDVPLDVLVIDMDWHLTFHQNWFSQENDQSGHRLGWSGYTWNKLLFPDPDAFLKKIKSEGLKTTLNLHPASGVQPHEDAYPEMARRMGIDPATKKYVPFDITDKKFAENYMDVLHHPLEKRGIDFWWLDWQQEANTKTAGVNPTWWLNYVHFTDQEREGKRPLLFHRWGGLGNHRYEIGFSGDTVSVWDSLAFQPWFTATAANVGYAYWSHDIGGHMPGAVDPELYTRWIQFGTFSPILRTHTTKNPDSERRIWAYPEPYSDIMRDEFHLRYALIPYIYTEARRTYDTGVAFLRPLYYDWPEAEQAYTAKNEYLFGDNMLVAPVTSPIDNSSGLASESIWLPEGEWIEWSTGKHFIGPVEVTRKFSIRETPVYVGAGAIVPMAPKMRYTSEKPVDPLIVNVFPLGSAGKSSYTLYEDSSKGRDYEMGKNAWTDLRAAETNGDLTVTIAPVRGNYPGMLSERSYEIRLPGDWPPEAVSVNGRPLALADEGKPGWRYDGNTLTTVVTTPRIPVTSTVTVHVRRTPELVARRSELDGFAGAMTRLREAYDSLNETWPLGWSPDELIDAMQSGDRLGYHPETVAKEIAHYREVLPQAQNQVLALTKGFNKEQMEKIASRVGQDWKSDSAKKKLTEYNERVGRALAEISDVNAGAAQAQPSGAQ